MSYEAQHPGEFNLIANGPWGHAYRVPYGIRYAPRDCALCPHSIMTHSPYVALHIELGLGLPDLYVSSHSWCWENAQVLRSRGL